MVRTSRFSDNSEEARFIHAVLGEFLLVGFFANGEIHKSMLYGFTGVLTLFVQVVGVKHRRQIRLAG